MQSSADRLLRTDKAECLPGRGRAGSSAAGPSSPKPTSRGLESSPVLGSRLLGRNPAASARAGHSRHLRRRTVMRDMGCIFVKYGFLTLPHRSRKNPMSYVKIHLERTVLSPLDFLHSTELALSECVAPGQRRVIRNQHSVSGDVGRILLMVWEVTSGSLWADKRQSPELSENGRLNL